MQKVDILVKNGQLKRAADIPGLAQASTKKVLVTVDRSLSRLASDWGARVRLDAEKHRTI